MKATVTGGANGIGAATVKLLLDRGWDVTVLDLVEPSLEGVKYIKCDLSDDASIAEAFAGVEPGQDALISNAGIPPREGWGKKILSVNLIGTRMLAEMFEAKMAQGGAFVHVASLAGHAWQKNIDQVNQVLSIRDRSALAGFVAESGLNPTELYNLSKEAVTAWTAFQSEDLLAKGFRANSVSPAATSTEILVDFENAYGEMTRRNVARIGRPGTPEECAQVIAFLASPDSSWVKGVDIRVDGGLSAMLQTDQLAD